LLAQLVLLAGALWCAPRRLDVTALALGAVTGVMALSARRFVPLFALVATPFLAANLALVGERVAPRAPGGRELASLRAALLAAAIALVGTAGVARECVASALPVLEDGLFEGMITASFFPRDAVEFLRRNPLPARLYNLYNWGGYLMYMLPE